MDRKRCAALFLLLLCFLTSCKQKPDTLKDDYDEQEMEAAIARARAEIPRFVDALAKKDGSDFSVKAPITDENGTEHFWLVDITFDGTTFSGKIGNEPGIVSNVKEGQSWTIKKSEISDWMYMRDGKIHGNYTMRPILKRMPAEEAERWRKMLAEP